jgi:RHH-type proline utilization regulon transcriptional repressor/proline dehydrogenase/delta 1-pyrroline-5-carboxylate dehydrogenase
MTGQTLPFILNPLGRQDAIRRAMHPFYRAEESMCVEKLVSYLEMDDAQEKVIRTLAENLVQSVRDSEAESSAIEALMLHYDLSTEEGILLMCLAEALLRVPDKKTEQLLIKDKLTSAHWEAHIGASESSFVNMATWGLALSGKILGQKSGAGYFKSLWQGLVRRGGEPVIRKAVREAMKVLSEQFVVGRNINEALKRSRDMRKKGYRYSYDMLGEVARTQKDADHYYKAYYDAISSLGESKQSDDIIAGPSISVKLSALYPRYEYSHRQEAVAYLIPKVKELVLHAKQNNLSMTIDAEEADRLQLSLDIFEAIFCDPDIKDWEGLGLAVQAYQKRAFYLFDWLIHLAKGQGKRIQVRLVKGAYWDSEIKLSQVEGFSDYPVFTRKVSTDISYFACAKKMLSAQDAIYPQFATHNAYSVAAILSLMSNQYEKYQFEFQNLQGMGKDLHNQIVEIDKMHLPCRIYAPVGSHEDLLPYLVRRLLENGANSSFVNRIADSKVPISELIQSPVELVKNYDSIRNSNIPLPCDIYGSARKNAKGMDLSDTGVLTTLAESFHKAEQKTWQAAPFLRTVSQGEPVRSPANHDYQVGVIEEANQEDVQQALVSATSSYDAWAATPVEERSQRLMVFSDLLEKNYEDLMYLAVREAGKTLPDAIAEVREAIDFCRYYAEQANKHLVDQVMPGPTGETNILRMHGRGVFVCISPWNFPLAIFIGQVAAALVTGNTVIAKPAEQTALIAALAVKLFYDAGFPEDVLQLLPGRGAVVGAALVQDPRVSGVMFTGSTETARGINQALAARPGAIVPFIAETGGMNAMIADSTALAEQLVRDVIMSAFGSAGQRCSALRLLYVQDEIADGVIEMLHGAMQELYVDNTMLLATDVGPVIDEAAQKILLAHCEKMRKKATLIFEVPLADGTDKGTYVAPQAYEIADLSMLEREVFGPVLHVLRYKKKDLDKVIDEINATGYGLTFGIQSRISETVDYIQSRMKVGNIYVNRNMVGAVVGVQPFGGRGLSGTGPKAGGPHYLLRLCTESTLTIDTTAAGGNASLMALED